MAKTPGRNQHGRRGATDAAARSRLSHQAASLRLFPRGRAAGRRHGEPAARAAVVAEVRQKHQAGLLQHGGHDLRGDLLRSLGPGLLHPGGLPAPAALGGALRHLPAPVQALAGPARPLVAQRPAGHRHPHRGGDPAGARVVPEPRGGGDGEGGAREAHAAAGHRGRGAAGLLPLPVLERRRHAGDPRARLRDHRGRAGLLPHRVGEWVERLCQLPPWTPVYNFLNYFYYFSFSLCTNSNIFFLFFTCSKKYIQK